jgi:hypothetical protein
LPEIKALPLGECRLTAKGNRLSVIPITAEQFNIIEEEIKKTNAAASPPADITRTETEEFPVKRKVAEEKKQNLKKETSTNGSKTRTKRSLKESEEAGKSGEDNNRESDLGGDEKNEESDGGKRKKRKVRSRTDK